MALEKKLKNPFSAEEDSLLSSIVNYYIQNGMSVDWNIVSGRMPNRNARQCRDRWQGYLDSSINRDEFTNEENYFILKKVEEVGKKWKVIASQMKHRTDVAVKAQYRKLVRRNISTDNVFHVYTDSYQMKVNPAVQTNDVIQQGTYSELEIQNSGKNGLNFPNQSNDDNSNNYDDYISSIFAVEDELFDSFFNEISGGSKVIDNSF
ncbi:Myb-like DNA-binding domain containing protein [Trichomonas vaginalis G3]|uniref:Myb-like DNA-binding domain containing protein n=1 Tax=Trichomonas vaginalis (strain ATCC PRA-98 / G3) TaxID=412133 RepID=A2DXR5_TRIV3|nr:RNA polymerase II transcription regulator recruiting protein [Trichomonas vaginalis G3]EAY14775.1 Myb-like DNA-binding domain containing protein [Trichomonas vaginalis G3]KAI5508049.1 RNA polymerase II transcription regulator recruiting protein [Trichomonas vaginalis G3]|eukprot:XP_001326998.1 Myb-like DNA-binding domain containing protein [Trichomonas vaginalis G3]